MWAEIKAVSSWWWLEMFRSRAWKCGTFIIVAKTSLLGEPSLHKLQWPSGGRGTLLWFQLGRWNTTLWFCIQKAPQVRSKLQKQILVAFLFFNYWNQTLWVQGRWTTWSLNKFKHLQQNLIGMFRTLFCWSDFQSFIIMAFRNSFLKILSVV